MMKNNSLLWSKEEYQAVVDYKGDYYNAINVLMSEDVTMREITGTEKSKNLVQSKEEFEKILEKAILVYSAIKKSYTINSNQQYSKKLFRGTREGKKDMSFLSTSDSFKTAFEIAKMHEGFRHEGDGTLLLIDNANVPWIDIDRLISTGDRVGDEPEILFVPSKIDDLKSIDLTECIDIANGQGEKIFSKSPIFKRFSSLRCKKVCLSELDYSSEKSDLSKDDICNMFEQYKQDLNAIRKIPQNTAEYKGLFQRIQNFKQKCCTWIHQKFYEINQSIDNQINMENDKIQVSPEQHIEEVFIGNTGNMYQVHDKTNNAEYYFKPAVSKNGAERPYRAHIQEAAYLIQKIINPENAVKCNVTEINGMFGAIQEKIPIDVNRTKEFKDFFDSGNGEISPEIISQLVDEYLVDFCLCNYDSHSRNFIIDTNGKLRGIDKEQSFRYIKEDTSKDMQFSTNYNERYGENPTVYNLLFEKMKQGEISYKYLEGLRYRASRLAQYPDDQYRNIFHQYAYGKAKTPQEAESLLDSIVDRKNNILQEIENLYNQIYKEQYKNRNNQANQNTENKQNPLHKQFSEQEIGKATINTPIQNKQQAMIREQKDIKQIQNTELIQE